MSTYQELKGLKVKFLDSATSGDRATEGEIFYNSSGPNVASHIATGAWSAGSNTLDTTNAAGPAGTQTAAISFGGRNPPAPAFVSTSEEYNGSGWAAGGSLNTARSYIAGMGTQTAALGAGGRTDAPGTNTVNVEEYDGSSWTEGPNLNTARRLQNAGCGTTTAGLVFGGAPDYDDTEEWNGTAWTESGNMNTGRGYIAGFGIQTAAVAATGQNTSGNEIATTEEYNGSTWSNGEDAPTATQSGAAAGTLTQGLIFGGEIPPSNAATNKTFTYDGTDWTASADMSTSGFAATGHGTQTAALVANLRGPGGVSKTTEEFNLSINTTTAAAWASSNNIGTARDAHGAGGTQTAGIIFGGNKYPGNTENTELYDGSSWTETANLNTARRQTTGTGTQTSALCAGGYTTANSAATEEWNGSAWTSSGDLATNRRNAGLFGIQTAAVYCGGYSVPDANSTVIQNYDGSSWTNNPASLNTGGNDIAATGSNTAGVIFGYSNNLNGTEEWNGSSMSTGGTMITSKYGRASANQAPSENVLSAGGGIPAQTTCEGYDGTSWSTRPSIATATNSSKGGGTATAAFIAGGGPGAGPIFNTSLEFTGDTTAASAKTIDFD
jgi:hypothetical protein